MRVFIFIFDILKKYPFYITATILLLILVNLIDAAAIFSIVPIVDFLIKSDLQHTSMITQKVMMMMTYVGLPTTLGSLLAVFLILNVLRSTIQTFSMYLLLKTKYAMERDIYLGIFEDFFNARWYFFTSSEQGTLLNTLIREIEVLGNAFGAMGNVFVSLFQALLYFGVPFYISWQVTSVSILTAVLFSLPFMFLGKMSYRFGRLNIQTANRINQVIQESFSSAKIILGFANQYKSTEALRHAFDGHRDATIKSQTLDVAIPLMYYPLGVLMLIITVFVGQSLSLTLAELSVLVYSLFRIIPTVGQIIAKKNAIDNFFPSYEQIVRLRDRAKQLKQPTGNRMFVGFDKEIKINNLCFAYPGNEQILANLNICIPKGKMIAFVGESGGGKSTLIDLIMGFNEPLKGQITIDEIPLRDFDIKSYRRRIGYVPQDSILFNMSITDNLLWANETASTEEIEQACRQAHAHEFIKEFPDSYNTIVGDRGVRLSGGQVQRIAIARAILRNPELLILDEATSSLDSASEKLIQQAIDTISRQTTTIVIAHRLSTIVNADYIYVLKNGKIVEEGTYQQLINSEGVFSNMANMQLLYPDND